MIRSAQIVAATLTVECPYCGEPQPAPDNGSDNWLPEQITAAAGRRQCVSCDETFRLLAPSKAPVRTVHTIEALVAGGAVNK